MVWAKEAYENVVCGGALNIARGIFEVLFLTISEAEEVLNLKKLAISVMEKYYEIVIESVVYEAIQQGK